jgi:hypothetical protein
MHLDNFATKTWQKACRINLEGIAAYIHVSHTLVPGSPASKSAGPRHSSKTI